MKIYNTEYKNTFKNLKHVVIYNINIIKIIIYNYKTQR